MGPVGGRDISGLASTEVEQARTQFIEGVSTHGQGVFTWAEEASPEAKALRAAIETGVPNQPADPMSPGTLDTIGSPELLQDALANLRERSRLSREAGDPREFGAIYFVTKSGREGLILSGDPGNPGDTPMAAMYDVLEKTKAAMGITSDDDITVISLHSHPIHLDDIVNGSFSMLQTKETATTFSITGDLYNLAGAKNRDAAIVTSDESGPASTGTRDASGNPQYGPGSVLAVFTKSWKQLPPEARAAALQLRETTADPLQSGTHNPNVHKYGDLAVTRSQARAGYPDRYALYVAPAAGPYERVRFGLPPGFKP